MALNCDGAVWAFFLRLFTRQRTSRILGIPGVELILRGLFLLDSTFDTEVDCLKGRGEN